jgi:hypothetical protein
MSAPELPDIFGNYALGEDFVEVAAPQAISWLPQTAGWKWLALLVALLTLRWCWLRLRRWYRNRYRREALARIALLENNAAHEQWLFELNQLLKLTALAGYPRQQVAALAGQDWVDFLNSECEQAPFSPDCGSLLARGVYTAAQPPVGERQQLLAASRIWVTAHRGRYDA